jgi:hypothetical protein
MIAMPFRFFVFFVVLLFAAKSPAVEVGGLFEATVPVANQGAAERARATTEGFRQVLVKASGHRAVLANPAVQPELSKAAALLGSYRYETQRAESGPPGTRIRLSFDAASVLGVLNRAGAPVWSANRPLVYLWTFREATSPTVFALGSPQVDALLDAAGQRGLPVSVPSPGDAPVVAGAIPPPAVVDAAGRVGARVIVAAAVGPQPGGKFRALGVMRMDDGKDERIEAVATDEASVLTELVGQAADALASRFGAVARRDQVVAVSVKIEGVRDLAGWAGIERWIASQPLVKDAVLVSLDPNGTEFALVLAGEPERLLRAMQADARFSGVSPPVQDGAVMRITAALAGSAEP